VIDEPVHPLGEDALRALVPRVLAGLVRRGEDFDAAEDALQEALLEALRVWPEHPPRDPRAWLATVATRRLVDARRSEAARHRREEATYAEPRPAATEAGDDTLFLLFCCCHPDLSPASQVALTLRAVGGLTTREIADAFYVPEATMAQRISRAKRALQGRRLNQPGDLAVVLRVLYLVYTAGHAGRVDLAGEAIRLARQLTLATEEPEARGLLYMLQQLTSAQLIVELVELAKEVSADARRGQQFDPPLNHAELAFYDAVAQNGAATELMGVGTLAEIARELVKSIQSSITVDCSPANRYAPSCVPTSAACSPATTTRRTTSVPPSTWSSARWKPSPASGRRVDDLLRAGVEGPHGVV
jgi:RNA polymerase sigma factor (sigma-70 family)